MYSSHLFIKIKLVSIVNKPKMYNKSHYVEYLFPTSVNSKMGVRVWWTAL